MDRPVPVFSTSVTPFERFLNQLGPTGETDLRFADPNSTASPPVTPSVPPRSGMLLTFPLPETVSPEDEVRRRRMADRFSRSLPTPPRARFKASRRMRIRTSAPLGTDAPSGLPSNSAQCTDEVAVSVEGENLPQSPSPSSPLALCERSTVQAPSHSPSPAPFAEHRCPSDVTLALALAAEEAAAADAAVSRTVELSHSTQIEHDRDSLLAPILGVERGALPSSLHSAVPLPSRSNVYSSRVTVTPTTTPPRRVPMSSSLIPSSSTPFATLADITSPSRTHRPSIRPQRSIARGLLHAAAQVGATAPAGRPLSRGAVVAAHRAAETQGVVAAVAAGSVSDVSASADSAPEVLASIHARVQRALAEHGSAPGEAFEALLELSAHDVSQGLTPAQTGRLPRSVVGSGDSIDEDCTICLSSISEGAVVVTLACRHIFHAVRIAIYPLATRGVPFSPVWFTPEMRCHVASDEGSLPHLS